MIDTAAAAVPVVAKYPRWTRSRFYGSSSSSYHEYFDVRYVYLSIRVLAYHILFVNRVHCGFTNATNLTSVEFGIGHNIDASLTINITDKVDPINVVDELFDSGVCSIHRTDQNESLIKTDNNLNYRNGTGVANYQLCRGAITYKTCVQPTIDQLRQFSEDVAMISVNKPRIILYISLLHDMQNQHVPEEISNRSTTNNLFTFPITLNCCQGYELRTNENGTYCSAVCSEFCLDDKCVRPDDCASCQIGYNGPHCTVITRTKHLASCLQDDTRNSTTTVFRFSVECGSCAECAIVVTSWLTLLILSAIILTIALRKRICCHSNFLPLDDQRSEGESGEQ